MENIIILGTGCAGLTAAIYAARANLNPLLIEGNLPGGLLTTTSDVENFPGFPEGVNGFELMDKMRKQAERFGARFENGIVDRVELGGETKTIFIGEKKFESRVLIVATGASPKMLGIPGEKEMFGGKGVSTCATCDGAFYRNMDVAIIGGGDSACEEAIFLTHFCSKVYLVHRRDQLRASKIMAERVQAHEKIELVWNALPQEVLADDTGMVSALRVKDKLDSSVRDIECKGVFLAIGHTPNTAILEGQMSLDESGYILRETGSQVKTSIPGVFAAGDCADSVYRQAISSAGMGCQAAIEAEHYLALV